jgi:phage baseplate assembly protein gpV
MHCDCHSLVYRALVTYSNTSTGEIRVKIPSVLGVTSEVSISYIGRSPVNDYWAVPKIGEQIVVSADDSNMTNVFWLQTEPFNPANTEYANLESLTDVTLGTLNSGEILAYNGSQWVNNSALLSAKAPLNSPTFTGTVTLPPQTIQTVTTRAIVSTDAGKMLTSSSNCVLTFNASTAFNQGQRVDIVRLAGTLTVSGSGVTLLFTPANTLRAINSAASIVCLNSTTYLLVGDLG